MRSTPDLGYTGEYNVGAFAAALTTRLMLQACQITDIDGDPYYEEASGRAARVRLDGSIRHNDCGSVTADLVVHDSLGVVQGAPLLTYVFAGSFTDQIAALKLPALTGTAPYYLGVRLTSTTPSIFEGFFRVVPYGQWGWEGVTLAIEATLLQIDDEFFNTAVYADITHPNELRMAKQAVRLRLLEAGIDPDTIWTDGVLATPDDDTSPAVPTSPSGIGAQVIACLVLPATYAAAAQVYRRVTGYKNGRLADQAEVYAEMYDVAMRGAIKSLLSVNDDGGDTMTRKENRPARALRMVM